MKAFEFSGFGNYSETHNWDNGLSCVLQEEMDYSVASEEIWWEEIITNEIYVLNENVYGGSRNLSGIVFAFSKEEAEQLLRNFEDLFPVVEYVQD